MNVMVTGATTPLGTAIVRALVYEPDVGLVLALGREPQAPWPADRKLVYRPADLTRPRVLRDLVHADAHHLGIGTVIHAMQHRRASDRGQRVHAQNVETARELLLACREHPTIRRLVYRSFAEVYALDHVTSNLLDEEAPLDLASMSQWVRDRVEADITMCAHFGGDLQIAVLRCAEVFAPECGGQLWDYLKSRVCLRPLGFDPIVNVLSLEDATCALLAALHSSATGVFNIPGKDTLPLSTVIAASHRAHIPVPGPLMHPLYQLRHWIAGFDFRYDMNVRRFHFGGILDGTRARNVLGFTPRTAVQWPKPRWLLLIERLAEAQRTA